ncbi:hypothetical protein Htur_4865 (plasmid) [Haloterrigena turkmenica DSM 5511]|uniref:DUF7979 domain-containing protein n=1 Tax=Haloterrigena turkmenica (strain ATCC 51198 / DSM 5511 / JCM 9101 / NCIMB 13204 / VKM B-1734 / 4k) TaxID=543526 RepID=D2S2M5_HALTV|nr:hypothetical protein [Haloterrigena turkmenica]ADB63622.1 hypothetical protein Htur_4865 [Haloterrigena turkmenica DSM 5511]
MSQNVTLKPVENVPSDSRICHYDELGEDAKEEFPILTENTDASVDSTIMDGFEGYDLVKYTDYYEVSIS